MYTKEALFMELIVIGIYILIIGFFLLIIVRLYQALTIYVIKNAHYLPSGIFIRKNDLPYMNIPKEPLPQESKETDKTEETEE